MLNYQQLLRLTFYTLTNDGDAGDRDGEDGNDARVANSAASKGEEARLSILPDHGAPLFYIASMDMSTRPGCMVNASLSASPEHFALCGPQTIASLRILLQSVNVLCSFLCRSFLALSIHSFSRHCIHPWFSSCNCANLSLRPTPPELNLCPPCSIGSKTADPSGCLLVSRMRASILDVLDKQSRVSGSNRAWEAIFI